MKLRRRPKFFLISAWLRVPGSLMFGSRLSTNPFGLGFSFPHALLVASELGSFQYFLPTRLTFFSFSCIFPVLLLTYRADCNPHDFTLNSCSSSSPEYPRFPDLSQEWGPSSIPLLFTHCTFYQSKT